MKPVDPRLLPPLAPARTTLAGALVASIVAGLLVVAQAFAVAALITRLLDGDRDGTFRAATVLVVVLLGRAVAGWVVDACTTRASAQVTRRLRRQVLEAALSLGVFGLSRRHSGELATLATRGVTAVDPYLTRYLPALFLAGVLPPVTVLAIGTQDLISAVIVLATLPLLPVFAILVGLATKDRADRQWQALSALAGHFVDVMRGLPTLVVHRRAKAQAESIRRITDRYRRATNETLRLAFASSAVLELVATISVALVAVTVGLRLAGGSLDLGTALVVLLLAPEAYWPVRRVGAEFHAAAEGTATFEAVDALLAKGGRPGLTTSPAEASGVDRRHLTPGIDPASGREVTPPLPAGGIVVEDLTVRYPDRIADALTGFGCRIPPRGLTAIAGPSGAGKSTLLAVLLGELAPTAGTVRVGELDLTHLTDPDRAAWQARIAWVPQRPWLLPGSVRDNVLLGRPEATDTDVWAALERVALADLVATLPGGLDEPVGEDGASLSAGERARLVLARAVVARRPLVLLDEPTAHLDAVTEQVVADTLTWLAARSAVVVVAHRPSLVALADHVVQVPTSAVAAAWMPEQPAAPQSDACAIPAPGRDAGEPSSAPCAIPARADEPAAAESVDSDEPAATTRRVRLRLWAGAALGALAAASGVALTATAGWLIAKAAEQPPVLTLMVAIVGVRTFGLARPALRYAERLVSHDVALRLLAERRAAVYDALVPLVPGRLGRHRGDVLTAVVDDVDALVDKHLRVRAPLLTFAGVGVLATAFATAVLPVAGLVTAAGLALGGGLAYLVSHAGVAAAEPAFVTARASLGARVVQTLQGAPDLLLWQAHGRALDEVDRAGDAMAEAGSRSARAQGLGRALALAVAAAGMALTAWVCAPALDSGALSGPMAALLVLLPLALLDVVTPLADAGALQVRTAAADERLAALAARQPAVTDPAQPAALPAGTTAMTLDRVFAGWPDRPVLRDLSLDLPPGSRLGVVGPSGCGKSTLAAVLLRFLDPHFGALRIGPTDARELALDDVRRTVGLVDDDPHVFASTLRENLRLARPEARDDDLVRALRTAQLGPWLAALPRGLDTWLGDGHAHVSGGERARIALARAVLADAPVLVLDEPIAHLDTATARAVTADLLDAATDAGRTVVWITHASVGLERMGTVLDLGAVNDLTGGSREPTSPVRSVRTA
ncbi:MAG: thiol reductant ABC exporter subunit CydD [Nocardioides sp.]